MHSMIMPYQLALGAVLVMFAYNATNDCYLFLFNLSPSISMLSLL